MSGQYEELARKRVAMMLVHAPARMLDYCAPEQIGAILRVRMLRRASQLWQGRSRVKKYRSSPARSSCSGRGGDGGDAHEGGTAHQLHTRPLVCSATGKLADYVVLISHECLASSGCHKHDRDPACWLGRSGLPSDLPWQA